MEISQCKFRACKKNCVNRLPLHPDRVRIGSMNKKELEAFAREAAKTLKTEKDLNEFSQMLTKITVEAARFNPGGYTELFTPSWLDEA